jgi:ribosome modulation factor
MKKHKRDREQRAFARGYRAGAAGRSRDLCPHSEPASRQFWLSGWQQGRADQWGGNPDLTIAGLRPQ